MPAEAEFMPALGGSSNNEWQKAGHVTKADLTRLGFSAAVPAPSICITGENCTPQRALFLASPREQKNGESKHALFQDFNICRVNHYHRVTI